MGIKKWMLPQHEQQTIAQLSQETGLSPLVCAVLHGRGYQTKQEIDEMLGTSTGALANPYTLIDMDKAVERIRKALEQGEKIAVYGDYDCDGITSTALLTSYLQSVGADVFYYIPSREKEGYGLNKSAIDFVHAQGAALIVTVDNGVSAHEEVAYAAEKGIDIVITDHHTPRETLPEAVAVVNPHRTDCPSHFKHLAGVGVAFKLVCALEDDDGEELLEYYSDIVALGTVADVVSLTGENRIVKHGLQLLSESQRPGICALLEVCGLTDAASLGAEAVAFALVPRLNAAGRMDQVDSAVELLLTDDVPYAKELAQAVNTYNEQRKQIENTMMAEIDSILAKNPQILSQKVLIISGEGWHHGVVGIVAAKVLEKYGKPTILFSVDGGAARGSGRSIEGFSLIEAISACAEHLTQYGGHVLAAGLTVPVEHLQTFMDQMQAYAAEQYPAMPVATCRIDCLMHPEYFNSNTIRQLSQLEPFGQGNKSPLFLLEAYRIEGIYPTSDKKHLRIRLKAQGGEPFYAVYFRMDEGRFAYETGDVVDIAALIGINEYNGKEQLSVKIQDLRLSGVPQEQILQERVWYSQFKEGQIPCNTQELEPQREDLAVVYKYLRAKQGFAYGADELYYRIWESKLGYAKMRIALDVFEEMGLISRDSQNEEAKIRLLPAKEKVDMEQSKILISLRV